MGQGREQARILASLELTELKTLDHLLHQWCAVVLLGLLLAFGLGMSLLPRGQVSKPFRPNR